MSHKILFLLFVLALGIFGCKKNDCIDEPKAGFHDSICYFYTTDRIISNATVNPSYSDELLLFVTFPNCTVYRYNLKSKELLELYKTHYYEGASWSQNDWIVFAAKKNIWKMKSNKDS